MSPASRILWSLRPITYILQTPGHLLLFPNLTLSRTQLHLQVLKVAMLLLKHVLAIPCFYYLFLLLVFIILKTNSRSLDIWPDYEFNPNLKPRKGMLGWKSPFQAELSEGLLYNQQFICYNSYIKFSTFCSLQFGGSIVD